MSDKCYFDIKLLDLDKEYYIFIGGRGCDRSHEIEKERDEKHVKIIRKEVEE